MHDTGSETASGHRSDAGEGGCLLYVDPDDDARATVAEAVAGASDLEVRTETTAAAAERALVDGDVDCLVSEYDLPETDGLAFLRRVGTDYPGLPLVLFTADGSEALAAEAVAADLSDYVPKDPLAEQAETLVARVTEILGTTSRREAVLGRMTDAFVALDTQWRFTYLNEEGLRVVAAAAGTEPAVSELRGRNIWEAIPEAVGTTFEEHYRRAMDDQEAVSFEAYYDPLDTWFEVRAFPSPTGLSVYFRDVTDRHERERRLAERERVLTEMHRVISDKEATFEEQVDDLISLGREVLGTDCGALSRVDDDDYVFEVVQDAAGNTDPGDVVDLGATNCERAVVTEQTLVLEDVAADAPALTDRAGYTEMGVECYLGTPVVVDGEVYGTFCFYDYAPRSQQFDEWEVTLVELLGDWISYEQERIARQRALERERNRLEEFANFVSHDLRNPLNVAIGHLELLERSVEDGEDPDPERVHTVGDALDRMDALIEDVLALARSGDQVVDEERVALGTVVESAWATAGDDRATIDATDAPETVVGDASRLTQLFENLFRNAVEHGTTGESDDGTAALRVEVGTLPDGDGFYVADDGPGIPESERETVFDQGYTTSEDGTGFGLAIVDRIATAHGGTVTVTESESGGARFEVSGLHVEED